MDALVEDWLGAEEESKGISNSNMAGGGNQGIGGIGGAAGIGAVAPNMTNEAQENATQIASLAAPAVASSLGAGGALSGALTSMGASAAVAPALAAAAPIALPLMAMGFFNDGANSQDTKRVANKVGANRSSINPDMINKIMELAFRGLPYNVPAGGPLENTDPLLTMGQAPKAGMKLGEVYQPGPSNRERALPMANQVLDSRRVEEVAPLFPGASTMMYTNAPKSVPNFFGAVAHTPLSKEEQEQREANRKAYEQLQNNRAYSLGGFSSSPVNTDQPVSQSGRRETMEHPMGPIIFNNPKEEKETPLKLSFKFNKGTHKVAGMDPHKYNHGTMYAGGPLSDRDMKNMEFQQKMQHKEEIHQANINSKYSSNN